MATKRIGSAVDFREAYTWGRPAKTANEYDVDVAPARVRMLVVLEAIEYREIKGTRGRRETYRHTFEAPYAVVADRPTGERGEKVVSSQARGAPSPKGALAWCGELVAIEGASVETGEMVRLGLSGRGYRIACDPVGKQKNLYIVRAAPRARKLPPLFILRGRSRYTVTERGIEG